MAELADLFTTAAARTALAQRAITAVYRLLCAAGITQAAIGRATGQGQNEVSEIISGRRVLSVVLLERIADGLGVPRGWLGLAYSPGLMPEPAVPDEVQVEDEVDGNLFRHAGTVLLGAPIFGHADPLRVQPAPTPVPGRIGLADVEQVAATTERLSQLFGDFGGIPVTDALTAHAQASEALLGAMDCAAAAGDLLRAVMSLDSLGCMELDIEPNAALKFFQLGAATAPSPLSRAMLEYHCSLAFGLLDLGDEALTALRRGHDSYAAGHDEPRPWKHFATALPHVEGRTHLALGRFDRAAAAAATAAEASHHAVQCTVSNSSLLAARVISLAKGLRSLSVRDHLASLQAAAEARRDSACRDLAHELATLRSVA